MRLRDVSFAPIAPIAPIAPWGWLAATLAVLCMSACGGGGGGPTMPSGADSYTLSAAMKNASGAPTILEATIRLDGFTVADSCKDLQPITDSDGNVIGYICDAPAAATVTFSAGGSIGPGSHRLEFFLLSPAQAGTATYTVPPFKLAVTGANGKPLTTINLPSQTASLGAGQSIVYPLSF
jgi:hypothetical protein